MIEEEEGREYLGVGSGRHQRRGRGRGVGVIIGWRKDSVALIDPGLSRSISRVSDALELALFLGHLFLDETVLFLA